MRKETIPNAGEGRSEEVMSAVAKSFGPLEKVFKDKDVFEFCVDAFDDIYIEKKGKIENKEGLFKSEKDLLKTIQNVLETVGRKLTPENPFADVRLADGTRVIASMPPMALRSANMLVKKPIYQKVNLDTMKEWGAIDELASELLKEAIQNGKNIVLAGTLGSGKMTFMNAMISEIDPEWRVVSVEKNAELNLQRKRLVALETLNGTAHEFQELVRHAGNMRGDYVVVSEVESGEAIGALELMKRGNSTICSLMSSSASEALKRLEFLCLGAGTGVGREDLKYLISESVDIIVTMRKWEPGGKRSVTSIAELKGLRDDEKYHLEFLYNDED
ncbi:MAG: ATPase, T2SS/T4P/T4SS family [Halobacteriovoraceae bacterium]|nr:ATPase, T2SS/T4P/T4SS family [Halobacteriovoraceae bacterium]